MKFQIVSRPCRIIISQRNKRNASVDRRKQKRENLYVYTSSTATIRKRSIDGSGTIISKKNKIMRRALFLTSIHGEIFSTDSNNEANTLYFKICLCSNV